MNDLHKKLAEDLASEEQAADLLPTVERLQAWRAPEPTPTDTARLLAKLESQLPITNYQSRISNRLKTALQPPFLLLRAERYLIRRELLAASALVMGIGTGLSLLNPEGASLLPDGTPAPGGLVLALIAPLVAALGISFLYGPGADPVIEIEESTPVSQRKILLARLTLIFGFNLIVGLVGSLLLAGAGWLGLIPTLNFFELVGIWLAPMTALSALAFFLTVLSGDPLAGTAMSITIWGAQAFRLFGQRTDFIIQFPNLLAAETRPLLWLTACALGVLALWVAGREGQGLRRQA